MTQSVMEKSFNDLEVAYTDAASELQSKQRNLQNYAEELDKFIELRDALKAHPEFSGALPETYYSGSDLDPEGVDGKHGTEWGEPGRQSWS